MNEGAQDPKDRSSVPPDPHLGTEIDDAEFDAWLATDPGRGEHDARYPDGISDDDIPPWVPDALGLVTEADAVIASVTADRLRSVHHFRVDQRREWRRSVRDAKYTGSQLTDDDVTEMAERSIRLELSCALRISEYAAERMMNLAEDLVVRYPYVLESMGRARISERHATTLISTARELPTDVTDEQRDTLVTQGLGWAETLPYGTFQRKLKERAKRIALRSVEEQHDAAMQERCISIQPVGKGMAVLSVYGDELDLHAAYHRLTATAKAIGKDAKGKGQGSNANGDGQTLDQRTLDQRRADVAVDLLLDGEIASYPDAVRGIRPTVAVTVPVLTLLGHDDEPAHVEGLGPITLTKARELAGGADSWMRVLTHPETGAVLSVGRDTYRPPAGLKRLIKWRAGRCMAPGCNIPASTCEDDHTVAWEDGGHTAHDNLCPLCSGHHHVKHHTPWQVFHPDPADGTLIWRSPTGRTYTVEPERRIRIPTFTPDPDPRPNTGSGLDDDPPPF